MGLSQRRKGQRVERELVQYLRTRGFEAQRVPLSGATTYAKGDVEFNFQGRPISIEVKARKAGFANIYKWLKFPTVTETAYVSTSIFDVLPGGDLYVPNQPPPKSLTTLKKLLGSCDILALKANNKPFIFIRYL